MRSYIMTATLAVAVTAALFSPASAAQLRGAFPLPSGKTAPAAMPTDCDAPLPAVVKLETVSKYRQDDPSRSKIDKEGRKKFERDVKPMGRFLSKVLNYSNKYVSSGGKKTHAAQCSLLWLEDWAKAGALTDIRNDKSYNTVGKYIAGMALAYLQIREVPGLREESKKTVEAWLVRMAVDLAEFHDGTPDSMSSRNNHRYWSGLGIAAAGVAADRHDLFDWGMEAARVGLRQIGKDGTMPLEMRRQSRAREYHAYALAPLVMLAELGRVNGTDLYAEEDGALRRLAHLVLATVDDPAFFEKATGKKQQDYPDADTRASRLSWLEPYHARFPGETGTKLLKEIRPVRSSFLGGNLTAIYSR